MNDYAPSVTIIELWLIAEDGQRLRATFPFPLPEPMANYIDAARRMTASAIEVDSRGLSLTLVMGKLLWSHDEWAEWWESAGLVSCAGIAGLAAHRAFCMWDQARDRRRGEHGPPDAGIEERDHMLSAALVGIAQGLSFRAAVAAAFEQYKPEASAADEVALLRRVTRYLRGVPDAG